jgi:hypothetical protein
MAKISGFDEAGFETWLATRPPVIQALARRLPPDRLYRLASSGHRVTILSYSEAGTVTVIVSGLYNLVMFDRRVFGIDPDDLTECEFPPSDEPIGTALTEAEGVEEFINAQRVARGLPPVKLTEEL